MKLLPKHIILIGLYFFIQIQDSFQKYKYEIKTLTVPLDHFSFANNESFQLRYLINDSYWNTDGPIFFYTGNEGDIETFAQNTGFMWDIAPEFNALLVFAEHRYYGETLPYGNESYSSPKHLGYLTSTQALADYVFLIDYLVHKNQGSEAYIKNPVVAFGGSYGRMLSAWLRMKYPASVIGAIAASAPIWQFNGLVPCNIYNKILTSVYAVTEAGCETSIKRSWPIIRNKLSTSDGKKWLSSKWKLCKTLENADDVENLVSWLSEVYSNLAMTNYPYPADFLAPLPAYPVSAFCYRLNDISSKPDLFLEQFGEALNVYANYTGSAKCIEIDSTSQSIGELGWDFQSCTEIIMPMCSTDTDMFEKQIWNFTKFSEECRKTWKTSASREDLAILEYGGKNIHDASNIVFSNGLLDPWSGGGVLYNISRTVLAILIPDGAHHLDLRSSNPEDPVSVIEARNFHRHEIRRWLRSYYLQEKNKIIKTHNLLFQDVINLLIEEILILLFSKKLIYLKI